MKKVQPASSYEGEPISDDNVIIIANIKNPKIRTKLEELDTENDGDIGVEEVLRLKKLEKWYKRSTIVLAIVLIIMVGLMFAVSYGAVELSKESHVSDSPRSGSMTTRRRLGERGADQDMPQTFVDKNGHAMVMGQLRDVSIPIGDGSRVLWELTQHARQHLESYRRRTKRRRLVATPSTSPSNSPSSSPNFSPSLEPEFVPTSFCSSHNECGIGEFCYNGPMMCAPCSECHFCHDGVGHECGACTPTMDEEPTCPPVDHDDYYEDDDWENGEGEQDPDFGMDKAFGLKCKIPEYVMRSSCPHVPIREHYRQDFPLESSRRSIAAYPEETVVIYESDLCARTVEFHFVISEMGESDEVELYYEDGWHNFIGIGGLRCWLHMHIDSVEALQLFHEMEDHRREEREEWRAEHGHRAPPHPVSQSDTNHHHDSMTYPTQSYTAYPTPSTTSFHSSSTGSSSTTSGTSGSSQSTSTTSTSGR